MKKILTALLFLLTITTAFAQKPRVRKVKHSVNRDTVVYKIDSVDAEGFLLNKGWKFQLGDNPTWANADIDDSKWDNVRLDSLLHTNAKSSEIGWYRKKIYVDSAAINKPYIFKILVAGAAEIYLNGQKIHEIGVVNDASAKAKFKYFKLGIPYSILFSAKGEQTLAIRFLFPPNGLLAKSFDTYPMSIRLKKLDSYIDELLSKDFKFELTSGISVGIFLMMAFIHFIFFYSFRSQRYNVLFSISMLMFAINFYVRHYSNVYEDVNFYYIVRLISEILYQLAHIVLLIAVYEYLQQPKRILFWAVACMFLLSKVLIFFKVWDSGWLAVFQYSLLILNYIFLIRQAIKDKKQSGKVLRSAAVAFIISVAVIFSLLVAYMVIFGVFKLEKSEAFTSLWIPIFITLFASGPQLAVSGAISFSLAKEFVKTNFSLQQKIVEVETLSSEKQHLLTSQNERLEQQVKERTEALHQSLEELKTTQTQLIQKEKLASLGELTAGIAHEIQNPLNFVNNFAEVSGELVEEMNEELDKGDLEEVRAIADDLKQNLGKINHHGKRASNIVKGMLEHSRASSGERQLTDINALADEYLRLSYHGLRAKDKSFNSDFKSNLDETLPKINVIPQDVGRVLLNLFNNAFYEVQQKAKQNIAGYKPMVTVSTKKLEENIEIRVTDNANGIPENIKSKIFQPFFTTKPTGEGTGLGLSLSYDIITKGHDGTMEVESVEGEGTTFIIKLPIS